MIQTTETKLKSEFENESKTHLEKKSKTELNNQFEKKIETEIKITKDMTMGEIVKKYPEAIEVMLEYGLHCVGCGAAYEESVEQGVLGHGGTPEEVIELVEKMNESIAETDPTKTLNITQKAADKLKEILTKEKKESYGLRVEVMPGGCAGFKYGLSIEEKEEKEDLIVEEKGVKIFIPKASLLMLKGAKIDYVDSLQGAGFRISNPNAHSSCGCGSSFT